MPALSEDKKKEIRDSLSEDSAAPLGDDTEGQIAPPTFAVPAEDTAPDAFMSFLARVDADTRDLLSEDELRTIFEEQQKRARDEKKALVKKRLVEQALHVAKVHEGLLPQSAKDEADRQRRMNELVTFQVELPPTGENGEIGDIGIRIDQRIYLHGWTYTVTRAEFDSLRDIMYRAGEAELMFEGKSRKYRAWMLSRGTDIVNPRNHIDTTVQ